MSTRLRSADVTSPTVDYGNVKIEFNEDTTPGRGRLIVMNRANKVLLDVEGDYRWEDGLIHVAVEGGEAVVHPLRGCGCGSGSTITEHAAL